MSYKIILQERNTIPEKLCYGCSCLQKSYHYYPYLYIVPLSLTSVQTGIYLKSIPIREDGFFV